MAKKSSAVKPGSEKRNSAKTSYLAGEEQDSAPEATADDDEGTSAGQSSEMAGLTMVSLDNRSLVSSLDRTAYKSKGVSVIKAETLAEVMGLVTNAARPVDVVHISMDLPTVDAVAVVKALRSDSRCVHVPIVLTSVDSRARIRERGLNAGADLFIEQPVPRDYFVQKIKKLLDRNPRVQDRASVELRGHFTFDGDAESVEGRVIDLSDGGLCVATEHLPRVQAQVAIKIYFSDKDSDQPVNVTGEVVRLLESIDIPGGENVGCGLAIRFHRFAGDSKSRLKKYLAQTLRNSPESKYY